MKNHILTIVCIVLSLSLNAQSDGSVIKLISAGEYSGLSSQMNDEIEMVLLDDADFYTANEAVSKLESVLTDIGPGKWEEKHVGGSKGGLSTYYVGVLKSSGGNYRLYIVKEKDGGDSKIVSIELEKL